MQKAKTGRHLSLHICRRQRQEAISLSAHLQKAKTGRHFSLEICRKQRQDVISLFRSAERKKKGRNLSLQICRKQRKDVTSLSNTQLSMPTTDRRRCDIKIWSSSPLKLVQPCKAQMTVLKKIRDFAIPSRCNPRQINSGVKLTHADFTLE